MRRPVLPLPLNRRLQLNFLGTIRPEYKPAGCDLSEPVSDEAIGALDAPDAIPAGSVYRAPSNGMVMQRSVHRPGW
ncbi:hypothetical protein [Pseudothauera rhizosphaerae]|uniref:Uncharacterized protein n=1 Tax=Pseudothauera rhizosphaerae TaxID=2565932 RepID=A0A4S4ASZ4_9RHOO|nr:hypothetical protein [Pseudothauera rhizosphaerae]THF61669.1 hypothetical protein E6O51_09480 [Pseudothauera rhizosphaerae]